MLPAPTSPDPVWRAVYNWVDQSRMDLFPSGGVRAPQALGLDVIPGPALAARTATYWRPVWQRALTGAGGFNDLLHTRTTSIGPHALDDPPVSTSQ